MKQLLTITFLALTLLSSNCGGRAALSSESLSPDERHRLYSAALASSDSPMETDSFKDVCRKLGIFDSHGRPNNDYMSFVSAHVDWALKSENEQFRAQINSREKARDYIAQHLPRQ